MSNNITRLNVFCETEQQFVEGFSEEGVEYCFHNKNHVINNAKTVLIETIQNNHTENLIHWKMFCDTEQDYVYGYTTSEAPLECFHNRDHIISRLPEKIGQIKNNNIKIQEEEVKTGGFFRSQGFHLIIPAQTSEILDISWKYPVSILSVKIQTDAEDKGNIVNGVTGPNTPMGILTEDTVIDDTVIYVSETVLSNSHKGLEILINGIFVGEVQSIDTLNKNITLTNPIDTVFNSGATVSGQRRIIKDFYLGYIQGCDIGTSKIGASYVDPGVITRVYYTNNSSVEKNFYFNVEYLY